jgi:hypothetical protein
MDATVNFQLDDMSSGADLPVEQVTLSDVFKELSILSQQPEWLEIEHELFGTDSLDDGELTDLSESANDSVKIGVKRPRS